MISAGIPAHARPGACHPQFTSSGPAMPDETLPETNFPNPEGDAPSTAENAPDPFVVLQNLQRENGELKDRLLRTLAEMENLRRRTEKEVADAKLYGISSFARDMLSFAD